MPDTSLRGQRLPGSALDLGRHAGQGGKLVFGFRRSPSSPTCPALLPAPFMGPDDADAADVIGSAALRCPLARGSPLTCRPRIQEARRASPSTPAPQSG